MLTSAVRVGMLFLLGVGLVTGILPGGGGLLVTVRQANPLLLVGLAGFLVFDQLTFWASFRAVGASPELALMRLAYLIGQLGNWLPVPGGIGGTELGLVGALILYGFPALTATAAVLLYRVIELWIPAVLGITAFVQLRLLLKRETGGCRKTLGG